MDILQVSYLESVRLKNCRLSQLRCIKSNHNMPYNSRKISNLSTTKMTLLLLKSSWHQLCNPHVIQQQPLPYFLFIKHQIIFLKLFASIILYIYSARARNLLSEGLREKGLWKSNSRSRDDGFWGSHMQHLW